MKETVTIARRPLTVGLMMMGLLLYKEAAMGELARSIQLSESPKRQSLASSEWLKPADVEARRAAVQAQLDQLIVSQQLVRFDVPLKIGVSLLLLVFALDGGIARWEGALFWDTTWHTYSTFYWPRLNIELCQCSVV